MDYFERHHWGWELECHVSDRLWLVVELLVWSEWCSQAFLRWTADSCARRVGACSNEPRMRAFVALFEGERPVCWPVHWSLLMTTTDLDSSVLVRTFEGAWNWTSWGSMSNSTYSTLMSRACPSSPESLWHCLRAEPSAEFDHSLPIHWSQC